MSANQNHRNIRARIQAFEGQTGPEEENGSQPATPELPPRRASYRPPVASKPAVAPKPPGPSGPSQNPFTSQNSQNQEPLTGPPPPADPAGRSVVQELEALCSKGSQRSRPFGLTGSNRIHEDESLPELPVKPLKEALKPNLNVTDHSWSSESHAPPGPSIRAQNGLVGGGGRRPTTIRVPSRAAAGIFQDAAPPLPDKNPIGSMSFRPASYKQRLLPSKSFQDALSAGAEPPLPPRKPSTTKSLPPRPPAARTNPGRPPPPSRSRSQPPPPSPKVQTQLPAKRGLVLPPRPGPGHRLYNSYTLPLPHAIASVDFDGSDTGELTLQKDEVLLLLENQNHQEFECQLGGTRGRVHQSRMKIITPLDFEPSHPQEAAGGGEGLEVKALFDFDPERPAELRLRAGDVVTGVQRVDSQWYQGSCNGSAGFFPVTYVQVLSPSARVVSRKQPSASTSGPRCVARFEFEGEHSDELSFSEGDVIQLKEYLGEDWARGRIGASVGIFPLNFVDVVEDLPPPPGRQPAAGVALPGLAPAPPAAQAAAAGRQAQTAGSGVEWAVARYDYAAQTQEELSFQKDDRILITGHLDEEWSSGRLNGREGVFPRAFIDASPGSGHQDGGGGSGTALYTFSSDCEEELSFQAGDVVTNLESVDEEWFLGELRGKRALVPKNYLRLLD